MRKWQDYGIGTYVTRIVAELVAAAAPESWHWYLLGGREDRTQFPIAANVS